VQVGDDENAGVGQKERAERIADGRHPMHDVSTPGIAATPFISRASARRFIKVVYPNL
jgi:hypothetical protein